MISDMRRLRRSNSSQTTCAKRTRIAAMLCSGAPSGSIRAAGLATAIRAMRSASARVNCGVAVAVKAPHEEVVDDLLDEVGGILDERHVGLDVADDPEAAEHLLAEAVRRRDRRRVEAGDRARRAARGARGPRPPIRRRAAPRPRRRRSAARPPGARASPCSVCTSRSRTRSRSSPVAIRVNVTSRIWSSGVPSAT